MNIEDYGTSAELDVWLRLKRMGAIVFITKPLMGYRLAEESYSHRLAKVRTTRHDIFKVLDSEKSLTYKGIKYKDFLEFKDISLRIINILRKRDYDNEIPVHNYSIGTYFKIGLESKWHLKIFIIVFMVYLVRPFYNRTTRKIL